jgi:hypothetical protein
VRRTSHHQAKNDVVAVKLWGRHLIPDDGPMLATGDPVTPRRQSCGGVPGVDAPFSSAL